MGENLPILPLEKAPGSELGSQSEKCDWNGEREVQQKQLTAAS